MKIGIISLFRHPNRLGDKHRSALQSTVPELIAALCPVDAEIELINEKERDVPFDRGWDVAFLSYLHADFEHAKVVSTLLRRAGTRTVAGGRHASDSVDACLRHFDAVMVGEPEVNVPAYFEDLDRGATRRVYRRQPSSQRQVRPARYDLIDFSHNRLRVPALEASRGCPFSCGFCVLTGRESYRHRPVEDVVHEIRHHMVFNRRTLGLMSSTFTFLDNNLGGSPKFLRELCDEIRPLRRSWGCAATFNVLRNRDLVRTMSKAGCRYVYTGLETLNRDSIDDMNKHQNRLGELRSVLDFCHRQGIVVSSGMLVGSDGDTNAYLERLPDLLAELKHLAVTFIGFVVPFPGTPWFTKLASEERLLPNLGIRDFDSHNICHRPLQLDPSEAVEHYLDLGRRVSGLRVRSWSIAARMSMNARPAYWGAVVATSRATGALTDAFRNPLRTYVGGRDALEAWDARWMNELGIAPERVTDDRGALLPCASSGPSTRLRLRTSADD